MSDDRNKTTLTNSVTFLAKQWMLERGMKPVETEVGVAKSWIADLAAIWIPTGTEAINAKLLPKRDWRKADEWNKLFFALPYPITICAEVKTSPADYNKDIERKFCSAPIANLSLLFIPSKMRMKTQPEKHWWIIECGSKASRATRRAELQSINDIDRAAFIAELAMRQHNRVTYASYTEMMKEERQKASEYHQAARAGRIIREVVDYLSGKESPLETEPQPFTQRLKWIGERYPVAKEVLQTIETLRTQLNQT